MKLLFLTGSRGEWGYIKPLLEQIKKKKDMEYSICATNMHLLQAHGMSIDEIREDGFDLEDSIHMSLDGNNHFTMTKSLGVFFQSFVDVVHRVRPDWIILAGDRGEQLVGAMVGSYTYTPVAHIQAGERSGNIDGTARHAITKLAHLHFAANEDAAQRLRKSGEEEFRVHMVGAPMLDELFAGKETAVADLSSKYNIDFSKPYLLVVQHPVTEEYDKVTDQIIATLDALQHFDMRKIWILPNNDAGSHFIRQTIFKKKHGEIYTFSNIKRHDYLGIMKNALCMVGNSSSGIIEAPVYAVPAVNIGRRQYMRVQGKNAINCDFDSEKIVNSIEEAISDKFRADLNNCKSLYGDGRSSERILNILISMPKTDRLLSKQITY